MSQDQIFLGDRVGVDDYIILMTTGQNIMEDVGDIVKVGVYYVYSKMEDVGDIVKVVV